MVARFVSRSNPKAKARELQCSWEALLEKHAKPLEKGRRAKLRVDTPPPKMYRRETPKYPSLQTRGTAVCGSSIKDPSLLAAIKEQASNVGQSYNKGGLQYLTPAERLEQRSGQHRRR